MSLYVNDIAPTSMPISIASTQAASVVSVKVRYVTPLKVALEWDLTPSSTANDTVSLLRVLQPGDLPEQAPAGYVMRAWAYDSGSALLFVSEEFRSPPVLAQHVTPPT